MRPAGLRRRPLRQWLSPRSPLMLGSSARPPIAVGLLAPVLAAPAAGEPGQPGVLRVCADPNNLPFSNAAGAGFENKLAELVAGDLGATVTYTWHAQRRGFIRQTLKANACDVIMGMPTLVEGVATT